MICASEAAKKTLLAIQEQVKRIDISAAIDHAASKRQTELTLTMPSLSEMFGRITEADINIVNNQPIAFRVFRNELTRLKYKSTFEKRNGEVFFVISWKDSVVV